RWRCRERSLPWEASSISACSRSSPRRRGPITPVLVGFTNEHHETSQVRSARRLILAAAYGSPLSRGRRLLYGERYSAVRRVLFRGHAVHRADHLAKLCGIRLAPVSRGSDTLATARLQVNFRIVDARRHRALVTQGACGMHEAAAGACDHLIARRQMLEV